MVSELLNELKEIDNLNITEDELQKLQKSFKAIDKEGTGMLDDETFFDIPGNPFVGRVKAVLDRDNKGSVSFEDFIVGLNQVAPDASEEEKLRFLFKIYDINNDGVISNGELFEILTLIIED